MVGYTEKGSMVMKSTRTPFHPRQVYTYILKIMKKKLQLLATQIQELNSHLTQHPYDVNSRTKRNELIGELCEVILEN
jgi:ribosomal protein S15P/S13E